MTEAQRRRVLSTTTTDVEFAGFTMSTLDGYCAMGGSARELEPHRQPVTALDRAARLLRGRPSPAHHTLIVRGYGLARVASAPRWPRPREAPEPSPKP